MLVLKSVCLLALGLVAYSYAIYPVVLLACAALFGEEDPDKSSRRNAQHRPFVSLIIAAHKEERIILERVHNALQMDYPAERLEVIIGCDGDLDATGELVSSVADSRIRLLQFAERRGKPAVVNDCVAAARGDVLAFSDANTFYDRDALAHLVSHFERPDVGGVVGELRLIDPATGKNVDGLYWRYENCLKRREGRIGALLGANGAIYAIRRDQWRPIAPGTIVDDFVIGMRVHLSGKRLVFDPAARACEESAPSMEAEFHRRARLGAGAFQSLAWLWPLLSPRYGVVAWAFWSHKVMRWFAPLFLVAALATNLALLDQPGFAYLLVLQAAGYGAAVLGAVLPVRGQLTRSLRLATMFVSMNAALLIGLWRWARGSQSGAWKRTARAAEIEHKSAAN